MPLITGGGIGWRTDPARFPRLAYLRPTEWTDLDLGTAMGMIADRVVDARRRDWQDTDAEGRALNRTMGVAALGGAALDNEENYLLKKLFSSWGAVQIENRARI